MTYLGQYLAGLARLMKGEETGGLTAQEQDELDEQLHQLWVKLSPQERAQARDWHEVQKNS